MKKKLAILLALMLVLAVIGTVLVACNNDKLSEDDLTALINEVKKYHKDDGEITNKNYGVLGHVTSLTDDGEIEADVSWTASSDKISISSEMNAMSFYTVTIPDRKALTEDLSYTLTATLVNEKGKPYTNKDGNPYTTTFDKKVTKDDGTEPDAVLTFNMSNKATKGTDQITWKENGITLVNKKGSSSTAPSDTVQNNEARFYSKAILEISYTSPIKALVLNVDLAYCDGFDNMTVSGATITPFANKIYIVFANPVETFTTTALGSQIRMYSLEVYTSYVPEFSTTRYETDATLLAAINALEKGEVLSGGRYTLTGEITNIDSPYNADYNQITVTMDVELAGSKFAIQCYNMKCTTSSDIVVGAEISVTGYIMLYNEKDNPDGKLEFTNNCTYTIDLGDVAGAGTLENPYSVLDAYILGTDLGSGKYSENRVYVKGYVVKEVQTSSSTGAIMCYISDVKGDSTRTVQVYYADLVADGYDTVRLGDLIVVYGYIQNYQGKIETSTDKANTSGTHQIISIEREQTDDDGTNYGTAQQPLSVTEALALAGQQCVNSGDLTYKVVYVTGKVITQPDYSGDKIKQFTLQDLTDSSKTIIVYSMKKSTTPGIANPDQNDTIVLVGYIKLYVDKEDNQILEFDLGGTTDVQILNNVRGNSTLTIGDCEGGTVSGVTNEQTVLNGTEVEFTVTKTNDEKDIVVRVNGAIVKPSEGKYTITMHGDTEITVELKVGVAGNWELVESMEQLAVGSKITLVYETNIMGALGTGGYFARVTDLEVKYNGKIIESLPTNATSLTLGKDGEYWTLANADGNKLGVTATNANNKLSFSSGTTTWTIDIVDGNAQIRSSDKLGAKGCGLQYNANSGQERFSSYQTSSQKDPKMYVLIEA